ncbi:hypothetical protein ONA91_31275 [Micromonospora sp. DR5-3]|uniref:hypothetical protein n=1 Tax=unclassified Micromonospora TaxID=2617518 RepID=UPI0011D7B156|nr:MULTISPECIES: hypothetical protein [unclassified Micromonospora]MCW3818930.1 hypothetical protein [Micromonospora sp. DR5-3]TYC20951.1 hypothetical protein FXF52_28695 [Micromonospora sp. MP36]
MLRPAWYLTDGDLLADQHNAAPPDLLIGVTALVGGDSGSGRAHHTATVRLTPRARQVTSTRSAASNPAAQR